MTTNVIKLRFIRDGEPSGREYTYFSNTDVAVGDLVEIEGKAGISQGKVTAINVPEAEIAPFKDKAKTIIGKVEDSKSVQPVKEFNVSKAAAAQVEYCSRTGFPHFAPKSGRCWKCNQNIYEQVGWGSHHSRVALDSPELQHTSGIDVESAGKELVTGCPHCHISYCD